ncbi:MAG: hypothetical protein NXI31_10590 [bacterium]|nr:hypothetical protein [bacterium]
MNGRARGSARAALGIVAVLGAVAFAVTGLVNGIALAPDETDRLRDDAFYEFAWAANLAAGRGPVVSDGVTTSGVQLLWSLLLVPVAWIGGAAALPAVAPWLGCGCHLLAAALLALRGGGGGRSGAAARYVAALLWLGNPLLLRECQNGQETALAALLLVGLWQARRSAALPFAILLLLATSARTDLLAFGLLLLLWRVQNGRESARRAGVTAAAIAGCFVAWNLLLGGGPLPDSGAPMAWLFHANHAATEPAAGETLATAWWYARPVLCGGPWHLAAGALGGVFLGALARPHCPRTLRWVPLAAVALAWGLGASDLLVPLVMAGWLLLWPRPAARRRAPAAWWPLALAAFAMLALHWAVRWYPRDYYAAPLAILPVIVVLRYGRLGWLLPAFLMLQWLTLPTVAPEPLVGQRAMALAGRFLARVVPAGERVGCFNSGLVTFQADVLRGDSPARRGIVNLDGVVHPAALAALQERRLDAALDELEVRFLVDSPRQFALDPALPHANGRWFGAAFDPARDLVELARFVTPGHPDFRCYWRARRGRLPDLPLAPRDLGPVRGGRAVWWPAGADETLEIEQADGRRVLLAAVERTTHVVLFVPAEHHGTGRLFVRGRPDVLLQLPRL